MGPVHMPLYVHTMRPCFPICRITPKNSSRRKAIHRLECASTMVWDSRAPKILPRKLQGRLPLIQTTWRMPSRSRESTRHIILLHLCTYIVYRNRKEKCTYSYSYSII